MLETNTQNNSALISLSRAAQLTGYHQDYLGQLCRLGKLSAVKVGRNWFTFPEALSTLSTSVAAEVFENEESVQEGVGAQVDGTENIASSEAQTDAETSFDFTAPKILQNITVSQVEGLPISIRTIPMSSRGMNNVQNILTTLRIENLQREVRDLRQLLTRLMAEVANHSEILQKRASNIVVDQLKHSYASNFDFNAPYSSSAVAREDLETDDRIESLNQGPILKWTPTPQPRYSIMAIVSAAAVIAGFAVISYGVVSGQFFGSTQPQVSTIYHREPVIATELMPEVAGDTLPPENVGTLR